MTKIKFAQNIKNLLKINIFKIFQKFAKKNYQKKKQFKIS